MAVLRHTIVDFFTLGINYDMEYKEILHKDPEGKHAEVWFLFDWTHEKCMRAYGDVCKAAELGRPVFLQGHPPTWLMAACSYAVKDLNSYTYNPYNPVTTPIMPFKLGDSVKHIGYEFSFEENGDELHVTEKMPGGMMGDFEFDADNMDLIEVPSIPAGKTVFYDPDMMVLGTLGVVLAYGEISRCVYLLERDNVYRCVVSNCDEVKVGDTLPNPRPNPYPAGSPFEH